MDHAHPGQTVTLSMYRNELVPRTRTGCCTCGPGCRWVAPPTLFGWNVWWPTRSADHLRTENVVIQKWHGTFAKGVDLAEAFHRTRAVEFMSGHLMRIEQLRPLLG